MKFILLLIISALLFTAGCGGSGGGVIPEPSVTPPPVTKVQFSGYVYGPSSGAALKGSQGINLEIINKTSQAPPGYTPVVNCLVKLSDGTSTSTNNEGWFNFDDVSPTSNTYGSPVILDPTNSSSHIGFGVVAIQMIIPGIVPPPAFNLLIVKPRNLILPVGGFFVYHVYSFTLDGIPFEIPEDQVEWFVNSTEGTIGSITPFGCFKASGVGKGNVLAKVNTPSGEITATGTIEIVPEGSFSTIKGQVYRIASDGTKKTIPGVQLFVSSIPENIPVEPPLPEGTPLAVPGYTPIGGPGSGTIGSPGSTSPCYPYPGNIYDIGTMTDQEGYYEFPIVPANEELTLNIFDPERGFSSVITGITLKEGETKIMDIDLGELESQFSGTGTVKYSSTQGGGVFIFETPDFSNVPPIPSNPIPLSLGEVPGQPPISSPPVYVTQKFVLLGLENFPDIRDKLISQPGQEDQVFLTGKINDTPTQNEMKTITVKSIEEIQTIQPL